MNPNKTLSITLLLTLFIFNPIASASEAVTSFLFQGIKYEHRWSKDDQNEFTPAGQEDLSKWHDMVTINLHRSVSTGDQLADIANRVYSKYQKYGKIIRTGSKPRTEQQEAEHLIVALLRGSNVYEVAFARHLLVDGVGTVVVYSHREYGDKGAAVIGEWVKKNGPAVEQTLMGWSAVPSLKNLVGLPQSK